MEDADLSAHDQELTDYIIARRDGGVECSLCGEVGGHLPQCPQSTEVWPVTADDLRDGGRCMDCGDRFRPGDYYTRRQAPEGKWAIMVGGERKEDPPSP